MIKLKNIINELGINEPKRYCLTQKGIEVINDINTLEKLLPKYNICHINNLHDSEEWVTSDMLTDWYGFDPSNNKIKLSREEIMSSLKNMDPETAEDMFENMKSMYIKYGYVEFK